MRHIVAFLAALLIVAGCAAPQPETPAPVETTTDAGSGAPDDATDPEHAAPVPAELADYYDQNVAWEGCGGQFECASVEVPMDYDDPEGQRIELALKRLPGSDAQGSLFINPGGPGGSGVDLMEAVPLMFTTNLRDAYDVIGFDPRGVGSSTAVECLSDAELDRLRSAHYDTDEDGLALLREQAADMADACQRHTGELLGHVDTVSAARDLDVLRHVVGDAHLNYLGYSYGTLLGATYAEHFPDNAGRMVLDGGIDPSLDDAAMTFDQAVAFEAALRAYVEDCLSSGSCPLSGSVDDGVGQIQDLLAMAEATPLPTGTSRDLTIALMASGIILPMYEDAIWPMLTSALQAAMTEQDGSQLLLLADMGADRQPDGTYASNSTEAFRAINCLDYAATSEDKRLDRDAQRMAEAAPTFGELLSYSEVLCQEWPYEGVERQPIHAEGAGPILVVGTTGDPATPYKWSVRLTEQLADATLLTFDGHGHTAYGRSNSCISEAVDGYLIDGVMPEEGLVC